MLGWVGRGRVVIIVRLRRGRDLGNRGLLLFPIASALSSQSDVQFTVKQWHNEIGKMALKKPE